MFNKIKRIIKILLLLIILVLPFLYLKELKLVYDYFIKLIENPENGLFFFIIFIALISTSIIELFILISLPAELNAAKGALRIQQRELEKKLESQNADFREKTVKFTSLMVKVKDIASAIDIDTLFDSILSVLEKGINADNVDIFMIDKKNNEGFLVKSTNHSRGKDIRFKLDGNTLISKSAMEGIIIVKENARNNAMLVAFIDKGDIPVTVCAPLFSGKELVGVINIEKLRDNRESINDEERLLLTTVCNVSALAMKNANVYALTKEELMSQKKFSQAQIEEKKKIREILSKYTSPSVMEEAIKNPKMLKLGGEKRIATVLFSDIRSFTSYSEKYEPEKVVSILNEYLSAMTDIIMEYNGTLDKFVGDEIMALWGVPVPQKNQAELAVKAAWNMLKKLKELHEKWKKENVEPMDIGIGINTGEMIAGNMGSDKRMDYTVIGDHVNTASRIEGLTRNFNNHFIISEHTYKLCKNIVEVKALGYVQVKGKSEKVLVYQVNNVKV